MFKFILIAGFVVYVSAAAVPSGDDDAKVLIQKSDVRADGFDSVLDTSNHIHQVASGDVHGNIRGQIDWISPEGVKVDIKYVADEHGYQPTGDLIPTPHPIPEAILKALAYIEAHPPKEDHHK